MCLWVHGAQHHWPRNNTGHDSTFQDKMDHVTKITLTERRCAITGRSVVRAQQCCFILGADVNKEEKNRFWKEKETVCVEFTRASSGTYLERV